MNLALLHGSTVAMDETAEAYVLGHLEAADRDQFDAHLLVCEDCRDQVAAAEEFITVLKEALKESAPNSPADS
jgi:anti-sigma-K factor RskA